MGNGNRGGANPDGPFRPSLIQMARDGSLMLPTLTVSDNSNRKGASKFSGDGLRTALLPTMCTRDEKGPGPTHTKGGRDLSGTMGGHLNPDWCRWFMGFPEGWLDVNDEHVFARSETR